MTGYRVVPDAMRQNAKHFDKAEDHWRSAKEKLKDKELPPDAAGLLGKGTTLVTDYNSALRSCREKLDKGIDRIRKASSTLDSVARHYEDQEYEYYRTFGYLRSND